MSVVSSASATMLDENVTYVYLRGSSGTMLAHTAMQAHTCTRAHIDTDTDTDRHRNVASYEHGHAQMYTHGCDTTYPAL